MTTKLSEVAHFAVVIVLAAVLAAVVAEALEQCVEGAAVAVVDENAVVDVPVVLFLDLKQSPPSINRSRHFNQLIVRLQGILGGARAAEWEEKGSYN